MGKCKKVHKRFDEINVIPFIDIMLVLLVIVLTTATFIKQGIIPIDLPSAEGAAKKEQENKKEINIYINSKGEVFVDKKQMDLKELKQLLSKISKKQPVILRSDKNSKFQDFVSIMDILKKLGHEELFIVTKK